MSSARCLHGMPRGISFTGRWPRKTPAGLLHQFVVAAALLAAPSLPLLVVSEEPPHPATATVNAAAATSANEVVSRRARVLKAGTPCRATWSQGQSRRPEGSPSDARRSLLHLPHRHYQNNRISRWGACSRVASRPRATGARDRRFGRFGPHMGPNRSRPPRAPESPGRSPPSRAQRRQATRP